MKFFLEFLHQTVPKQGKEIPQYYRRALIAGNVLLVVYYLVCFFFFFFLTNRWHWIPLAMAAGTVLSLRAVKTKSLKVNLLLFSAFCIAWVAWNVHMLGWNSGTQHFLTFMLVLVFFNIYEKPVPKMIWFVVLLAFRILLFSWSRQHAAAYPMETSANTVYQTINTVGFFLILAVICVIFSTNLQDTERQLRLRNQVLYKEAGTDALTGLPNRRSMIEKIEQFRQQSPDQFFCLAIADIDFFKQINDTYGHNSGDYTLVRLAELLVEHSGGQYSVCRWGGEEFCLFIPGKNLDEAGTLMNDLCFAVERMKLSHEGSDFSITITIGVEENDYASPLEDLINRADEKLYMGKEAGRNRVVV